MVVVIDPGMAGSGTQRPPRRPVQEQRPGWSQATIQVQDHDFVDLLTYQLYQATLMSPSTSWNLLTIGARGQTNFVLTNTLPQAFFRVGVLTNY